MPSQLALAWLLVQGKDIVPIPGAKKIAHLEENLGTLDIKLNAADMLKIDRAASRGSVAGAPYPGRK